jgi:hypothetical protein
MNRGQMRYLALLKEAMELINEMESATYGGTQVLYECCAYCKETWDTEYNPLRYIESHKDDCIVTRIEAFQKNTRGLIEHEPTTSI